MTIDHLLHHTSGLSDAGYGALLPDTASGEELVRLLASARSSRALAEARDEVGV